jgi:hypothetical protein
VTEILDGTEVIVYVTDFIWWLDTFFLAATGLFMLFFALKVREKGG